MDDLFRKIIGFDWDKGNIDKNWKKHKVTSKEAEDVFKDQYLLSGKDERHSTIEPRYKVLGVVKSKRYLAVFFTIRDYKIRIISARPMSRKDKIKYDKEKNN